MAVVLRESNHYRPPYHRRSHPTSAALTFVVIGLVAAFAPMYSLLSSYLSGTAAAGGIALVIDIRTLGGFLVPTIVGVLKQEPGGYAAGMAALAIGLVLAAMIVLAL